MRWILVLTLLLLAAGLVVWRIILSLVGGLPAVLFGMAAQFSVLADQALNTSFVEVQQNEVIAERLGGPLTFPAIDEIAWENAPPPQDGQLIGRFSISGPKANAHVKALLKADQNTLRVVELLVAPDDGGEPIEIVLPP